MDSSLVPSPDKPDNRTNEQNPTVQVKNSSEATSRTTAGQPPHLALEPDLLSRFRRDLQRAGVAGEERLAQLVFLALTSRVLPWGRSTERPVSLLAKGTTSTGKSHTTQTVLKFFPSTAYVDLGSMSRRYLFYDQEDYSHRFLIVPEWASIAGDDELVALVRTLLSEGRIIHGTVDRESGNEGKRVASRIEKEGPTGLVVTTTEGFVDPEMETRCLSLHTDDTPEQTRRVFAVFADQEEDVGGVVDFDAWHELQEWISSHGETRVYLPFVRELADLMPVGATRLRRDFVSLLCLVRAHAILYQAQRERDGKGRIVATLEGDYEPVRALIAPLIAEGVEASAPERTRETVAAVRTLIDNGSLHPSPKAIADTLGVGRSATYDRIKDALRRGYLVNESGRDERGYKLALGAELPALGEDFLPSVEALSGGRPDTSPGHESAGAMRDSQASSGSPARPEEVQRAPTERALLDEDGRCERHQDEPKSWCMECLASGAVNVGHVHLDDDYLRALELGTEREERRKCRTPGCQIATVSADGYCGECHGKKGA